MVFSKKNVLIPNLMKKNIGVKQMTKKKYPESRFSPYLILLDYEKNNLIDSVEKTLKKCSRFA